MDPRTFDLNAIGPDFIETPYPTLAALREARPVHRNPDGSILLTRYEDCVDVYRSPQMLSDKTEVFGQKFGSCPLLTHHTTSLVFNDPPYHTVVRKLIAGAFTPRKLQEMEPRIVAIVNRLLDQLEDASQFDLISDFAMTLPTEIISMMLGVPEDVRDKLRGYSLSILGALDPVVPPERLALGNTAVEEFGSVLKDLIAHRRRHPEGGAQGEVLEALIFGEHDGRSLTEEELIQNCIFLLNAGHETTTSLVGNAIGLLLAHPDQMRVLQEEPGLMVSAIEEVLRMESPLQIGNRLTATDTEIGGTPIAKGTNIHTSIAAANRDPTVFDQPDRFDITRKPNRHIAFITGIHVCLGATLARMEGLIAIGQLVQRFPTLAANGPAKRLGLARFRGYAELPVRV